MRVVSSAMATFVLFTMCGGCRPSPSTGAAPADRDIAGPEVQPLPAVEEPSTFTTEAYPLVKIPVGSNESAYRPAFLLDHYVFADPGRQLVTIVQFVWKWPQPGRSPEWDGQEMAALRAEAVTFDLIARCDRPTVTFRIRDADGCGDDYWLQGRQRNCIAGAAIACCSDELPQWTMWVPKGKRLPF